MAVAAEVVEEGAANVADGLHAGLVACALGPRPEREDSGLWPIPATLRPSPGPPCASPWGRSGSPIRSACRTRRARRRGRARPAGAGERRGRGGREGERRGQPGDFLPQGLRRLLPPARAGIAHRGRAIAAARRRHARRAAPGPEARFAAAEAAIEGAGLRERGGRTDRDAFGRLLRARHRLPVPGRGKLLDPPRASAGMPRISRDLAGRALRRAGAGRRDAGRRAESVDGRTRPAGRERRLVPARPADGLAPHRPRKTVRRTGPQWVQRFLKRLAAK